MLKWHGECYHQWHLLANHDLSWHWTLNYTPANCMLQIYRVFVHSQEPLNVLSVGPQLFLYRSVQCLYSYLHTMARFSWRWLLRKLKSHCLLAGFVSSIFYTFGYRSVEFLTRMQKSACTSWGSMASSRWKVMTSWSATLHTINPKFSLSVITSLLLPSNFASSLSSW